jgi:tetratricopeptide (TPR) repeat protein
MPETAAARFRDLFEHIERDLEAPEAHERRPELKAAIIELFRAVDREIATLGALKEDVKGLVAKWKAMGGDSPPAPVSTPEDAGAPTRTDHLNASSHIEKGWSLISLGEHGAAEAVLQKALVLVPGDTQAESLLGWAQMLQEKYDEALLNFQRVLQREPANSLARVNVGYICLKKGIVGEAIEHLSRTIRLDNDRKATLYAHFYLGLLYFDREMYDDAENFYRKAIALGPSLVEAHYELGRSRWFGGRMDAARQAWREGVAANKFSPWGKRCAEMLELVEAGGVPSR